MSFLCKDLRKLGWQAQLLCNFFFWFYHLQLPTSSFSLLVVYRLSFFMVPDLASPRHYFLLPTTAQRLAEWPAAGLPILSESFFSISFFAVVDTTSGCETEKGELCGRGKRGETGVKECPVHTGGEDSFSLLDYAKSVVPHILWMLLFCVSSDVMGSAVTSARIAFTFKNWSTIRSDNNTI